MSPNHSGREFNLLEIKVCDICYQPTFQVGAEAALPKGQPKQLWQLQCDKNGAVPREVRYHAHP